MEKLFLAIGVLLLIISLAALAIYGWQGQWAAVLFVVAAASSSKLVLGFAEIVLLPFSGPAIALAKRGQTFLSLCFMTIATFATKAAYSAFCLVILIYLVRTPGPPSWMTVSLSCLLAMAPFAWAAQRAPEDHPPNIDFIAAFLGVPISGILLLSGKPLLLSFTPVLFLFFISASIHAVWWLSVGMQRTRYEAMP